MVICPRSVGSLTTSEDVFILRFHDVIINTQGRAQEADWPAQDPRLTGNLIIIDGNLIIIIFCIFIQCAIEIRWVIGILNQHPVTPPGQ